MSGKRNIEKGVVATARSGLLARSTAGTRWWLWRRWDGIDRDTRALVLIVISSLCYSWIPVFYVIGGAGVAPVEFAAAMKGSEIALNLLLAAGLTWFCRQTSVNSKAAWQAWGRLSPALRGAHKLVALGALCSLSTLLFAVTLKYVPPIIATVLYETWPVMMIVVIIIARNVPSFRTLQRGDAGQGALWVALTFCVVGLAFIVLGKSSGAESLPNLLTWSKLKGELTWDNLKGVIWGATAAASVALYITFTRALANHLTKDRGVMGHLQESTQESFGICIARAVTHGLMLPVVLLLLAVLWFKNPAGGASWWILGWFFELKGEASWWSVVMAVGAAVLATLAGLTLRLANTQSTNYSINVVYYIAPILVV